MKKLLIGFVVALHVVTLIQVGGHFASAAGFTQCSDGINNDPSQDSLIDAADPGCHSDFNASNSSTYDSNLNSEINPSSSGNGGGTGFTQCSDGINNDPLQDSLIDAADPGCHSDFNANDGDNTYDSNLNSEINPSTGGGSSSYQCNDGIDNDSDGRTDMNDVDCTSSTDNSEFSACGSNGCTPPPTNRAPVCPVFTQQYPTYTVSVGSQFTFDIDATDPDGDSITYSLTESPSGMSINASTGLITWTPSSGQAGNTYDVTVRARDSRSASCSAAFTIRVRVPENPCGGSSCNPTVYICSDNLDNDGDNLTDYPSDPGCFGPTDNNEFNSTTGGSTGGNTNNNNNTNNNSNTNINNISIGGGFGGGSGGSRFPQCDDGRDNDGDGRSDYPRDSGCSSYSDDSEGSGSSNNDNDRQCDDNRDNDGDGDYDYPEDRGCSSRTDNSENSDDNNNDDRDDRQCDDNRDNDGDGDKDYPEDAGCSSRSDNSENSERTISSGSAPYFTSTPANTVQAGQIYSYNADAISPNGRDITYSLAVKPAGMTINSSTGLIQWSVPASLGNSYQGALVVAADTAGNQATQSYIISIRSGVVVLPPPSNPPVNNPPANNPPAQQELRIVGVRAREVDGSVIVSFGTNISARGSVRYGGASQADQDSDFTYLSSQLSENGQGTTHRVNLGALAIGQTYYIRAFATVGTRSTFSSEIAFTHREPTEPTEAAPAATAEVVGTDSCFDGIDNDKDGVADAADSDCEAEGQVAGTFASALESFGAFLISPWFLILVIIILIVYIIIARRNREIVSTTGPIEIKS